MIMKKRQLSQKQAWLYIARAFATPIHRRTHTQRLVTIFGLCYAVRTLQDRFLISEFVRRAMATKLHTIAGLHFQDYSYWVSESLGVLERSRRRAHWAELFATRRMSALVRDASLWSRADRESKTYERTTLQTLCS
jgi:hypothetical protein